MVSAIFSGIAAGAISTASNGIAKVAEKSAHVARFALAYKVSAGAAIKVFATFLVDLLTSGDMTPLDYILSGMSGGVAGGIAGNTGYIDDILAGILQSSLPPAISGDINFWNSSQ